MAMSPSPSRTGSDTAETLTGVDREIAMICIDVQRGAIGILTAVLRIREVRRNVTWEKVEPITPDFDLP